jgi:hypothetical protein
VKHYWLIAVSLLLLVCLGAAGCGGESASQASQAAPAPTQPGSTQTRGVDRALPTPTIPTSQARPAGTTPESVRRGTEVTPPPEAQEVVRLAKEDLAQRLGVAVDQIQRVSVEAVEWSDTSLGCPQPGMMYAQVITPGYRVVLEAEGDRYQYHTDRDRGIVLCTDEGHSISASPPPTGTASIVPSMPRIIRGEIVTPPLSSALEGLIDIAKQDLARRLGITPEEIEVARIEKAEWPDTSLGCAEPGLSRRPAAVPGYRVILSVQGREYVYHTGRQSGVVYCPKG